MHQTLIRFGYLPGLWGISRILGSNGFVILGVTHTFYDLKRHGATLLMFSCLRSLRLLDWLLET